MANMYYISYTYVSSPSPCYSLSPRLSFSSINKPCIKYSSRIVVFMDMIVSHALLPLPAVFSCLFLAIRTKCTFLIWKKRSLFGACLFVVSLHYF